MVTIMGNGNLYRPHQQGPLEHSLLRGSAQDFVFGLFRDGKAGGCRECSYEHSLYTSVTGKVCFVVTKIEPCAVHEANRDDGERLMKECESTVRGLLAERYPE
jgi:hypothetical protein